MFDGPEEGAKKKWEELLRLAREYRFAEAEGFTRTQRFPDSVYGHPQHLLDRIRDHPFDWTLNTRIPWPFNNSNTYVISVLDGASIETTKIRSTEFPGNRAPRRLRAPDGLRWERPRPDR